jgi:hypothetical protein
MRRIIGWVLVALGIIFLGAELDNLRAGKSEDIGIGVFMITALIGGGVLLLRSAARQPVTVRLATGGAEAQEIPLETTVLRLAKQHKGRVTPVEIATDAGIPLETAKTELERLTSVGACQLEVSEAGMLVFRFPEFEDVTAKNQLI